MANQSHILDDIVAAEAHVAQFGSGEKYPEEKKADAYEIDYSQTDANSEVIPNEEEQSTLRRVADSIPLAAWLLVLVELCERFSWYGTTGPMTNFVQQPLPVGSVAGNVLKGHSGVAGALGRGQRTSTAIANFRTFWTYVTPVIGAIIADTKLGRFMAVVVFFTICLIGHIILTLIAIPSSIQHPSGALAGFIISLVIMGLGTGGFKSNIAPLVAEQYQGKMHKRTLKTGEVVIVDPTLTIQRVFLYFYMMINVGALASLSTTFAEKGVGYWLAYGLPTFLFCLIPPVLWYGWKYKVYKTTPPRGSIILESWRVFSCAARGKWTINLAQLLRSFRADTFWDTAKPSYYGSGENGPAPSVITWDDDFVDEVRRGVSACKVFLFYPLYWISYDQMTSNMTSQAATMTLNGVPNEIVNNLNPISLVIFIPIFERLIYPSLRHFKINFSPIKRITAGFFFGAFAMVYTSVLQHYIYKNPTCGKFPSTCADADGNPIASPINVWVQSPAYVLIGISEIFASITGLEYAFTKAPERMKSVVMSLFLLQSAFASAIEFGLVSVSTDPYLVWMYAGVGITSFISGIAFFFTFRQLDADEDKLNLIGVNGREGFKDEK